MATKAAVVVPAEVVPENAAGITPFAATNAFAALADLTVGQSGGLSTGIGFPDPSDTIGSTIANSRIGGTDFNMSIITAAG
jgi:hypothetical protein